MYFLSRCLINIYCINIVSISYEHMCISCLLKTTAIVASLFQSSTFIYYSSYHLQIEFAVKVVALGPRLFVSFELVDCSLIFVAVVTNACWYLVPFVLRVRDERLYHGIMVTLSSLAVVARLVFNCNPGNVLLKTTLHIYPIMLDLFLLVNIIL